MEWYIVGEEALSELMENVSEAEEFWNEEMTEIESKVLSTKFKEKMIE